MSETATTPAETPKPLSLLAKETFGHSFVGEVAEPEEPAPEELPAEAPAEEHVEEPVEEQVDDPEGEEATAEADGQADEQEDDEIATLSELAEHLETDIDWLNTLKVPVKIDGQSAEAPLADLVANYQMDGAAEKRLETAKAKATEMVGEAQKVVENAQAQFAVAGKLIEGIDKALLADEQSVDWKDLRENDPAEFAAKRREYDDRKAAIEQLKRDAAAEYQQAVQEGSAQTQQQQAEYLQQQHQMLLEAIPEWRDSGKADAEKAELSDYLIGQGFSRDDVSAASDHRLIVMARKAKMFDEMKANSNAARKKVAKVPKVVKPGAPKPQEQKSREQQAALKARLQKSGKLDDAFALLKSRRPN